MARKCRDQHVIWNVSYTWLKKSIGLFCQGLGTWNCSLYGPSQSTPFVNEKIKFIAVEGQESKWGKEKRNSEDKVSYSSRSATDRASEHIFGWCISVHQLCLGLSWALPLAPHHTLLADWSLLHHRVQFINKKSAHITASKKMGKLMQVLLACYITQKHYRLQSLVVMI